MRTAEEECLLFLSSPAEGEYLLVSPSLLSGEEDQELPPQSQHYPLSTVFPATEGELHHSPATEGDYPLLSPLPPGNYLLLPPPSPGDYTLLAPPPAGEEQQELPLPLPPPPAEGEYMLVLPPPMWEDDLPLPPLPLEEGPGCEVGCPQHSLHKLLREARGRTARPQWPQRGPKPAPELVLTPLMSSLRDACMTLPKDAFTSSLGDACTTPPKDAFTSSLGDACTTPLKDAFTSSLGDPCLAPPEDACLAPPKDACQASPGVACCSASPGVAYCSASPGEPPDTGYEGEV
ncbi:UNVERIFIED_CONTAM: hypothetical protein FKN15_056275 [Acipenser sinensis]